MLVVAAFCALLVVATTTLHYEVLRGLNAGLPALRVPSRGKLLVVIFVTFLAHTAEILLYALATYALVHFAHLGSLGESAHRSFSTAFYFSAETYTSLGYGDIVPTGDLRLLAGVEALNGLLLIGWSASYTYIAMERFWREESK
jgi:hypothetical protein